MEQVFYCVYHFTAVARKSVPQKTLSRGCCSFLVNSVLKYHLVLLPKLEMLLSVMKKDMTQISSGSTSHINFVGDFCRHSIKT